MGFFDGILGETSSSKTTNRAFSTAPTLSGRGSFGQSFRVTPGRSDNFINIPEVRQQRRDVWNRTNEIAGAVQNDIQGLRALENPYFQARVRPTQEKFAEFEADTERGLARRGVFGTLATNELLKVNQAGTRAVADQGALAKAESFNALLANQQFQEKLFNLMRELNKDEATQALKELELLANIAGTSLSSIKETGASVSNEDQGDPSSGIGSLLDVLSKVTDFTPGDLVSDIKGLFDGSFDGFDSITNTINDITDSISNIFNSDGVTGINPANHFGDLVGNITGALPGANLAGAGAANIAAMGGGSLSSAGALGGVAAQNAALATGGVDAFTGLTASGLQGGGASTGAFTGSAALGAAIPLAVVGLGQAFSARNNAKGRKFAAPYLQAAYNAPMTTINGVRGLPIQYKGETYLADPAIRENPEVGINNGETILAYRPSTGEYGRLYRKGWQTDADDRRMAIEESNQNPDQPGGDPGEVIRDPNNMGVISIRPVATAQSRATDALRTATPGTQAHANAMREWEESMWGSTDYE